MSNKFKKEIEGIIYDIEIEASESDSSAISLYDDFASTAKILDPSKGEFAREVKTKLADKISGGEPILKIYRRYLPPATIKLLEETQKKGSKLGNTLRNYIEIRELADNLESSIRNKLKVPLAMSAFGTLIVNYLIDGFEDMFNDPSIVVSPLAKSISEHFLLYALPPLFLIALVVIFYPQKIWGVSKVYDKISSMLVVVSTKTLFQEGLSSVEIIPFLQRTFGMKRVRSESDTIKDLAKMLYTEKHIDIQDGIRLSNIKILQVEIDPIMERMLKKKRREAEELTEVINEAIQNLSTLLLLIPFAIGGYAIGSAMYGLLSTIQL